MMSRSLDYPASWWFYAAIHGEYVNPTTAWYYELGIALLELLRWDQRNPVPNTAGVRGSDFAGWDY
jgi:hypothetical protein